MSTATVLLIEDNRTILENTTEYLEIEGYSVISATDGKQGLEMLSKNSPDVIVCDIVMPEMDGLTLLEKLSANTLYRTIPLIFFSAKSEKNDVQKGLDAGAFDYIVKPSNLEDLLSSIHRCLHKRELSK